ncbi:uncharacterized protein LOC121235562 [Juglans microcarpa x Juglans regia]|uniref:uncharacterized protein LOC121235562 n=1 Tax=Juglans microcarpa x Juglans regia TaxID=2249226 RepID=UPI001B7E8315|nr:uncharacterized protein LOC121235562 [Juglans microcarpa x Juglans regia]
MGLGVIIRDSVGKLLVVVTAPKDHISTAAQAESTALLRAMVICTELGYYQVCFEGDAKVVVDAVNSNNEDNSWLGQMTEDMQQMMKRNQAWSLKFVFRSANKAAHTAAQFAIRDVGEKVWFENGPVEVCNSVLEEVVMLDVILPV